jgi:putative redox protein
MGKGESFSPTDLVATALGSCMLTIMGIVAQKNNIDITGTTAKVAKDMASAPCRRVGCLTVKITVPGKLNDQQKKLMQDAAFNCPVHKSLSREINIPVEFVWG